MPAPMMRVCGGGGGEVIALGEAVLGRSLSGLALAPCFGGVGDIVGSVLHETRTTTVGVLHLVPGSIVGGK